MDDDDLTGPEAKFEDVLGDKPYILIRIEGDHDEEFVNVTLETGGGFSRESAIEFMKDVIKSAEEN